MKDKQNKLSLSKRLLIAFGIVTFITIIVALISIITSIRLYIIDAISARLLMIFISVMVSFIIISIVTSNVTRKILNTSIVRPLNILNKIARQIAEGDVSATVKVLTKDEVGELMKAFKDMIEKIREQENIAKKIAAGDLTVDVKINSDKDIINIALNNIVENINDILFEISSSSNQVVSRAKQISDVSNKLSEGATEQASSIMELSISIEDIQNQVKLNAENANNAKDLSFAVKNDALKGNLQMNDMLNAMNEINESSFNISKVIKVIDDIAFQTNILSLNAAVEAARAGQHGKGFAVVADEVRNLSARSAKAAKETTDLIENSINKAELGTIIAKKTADSLNKIVEGVEKVALLLSDIADASKDQTISINNINMVINEVSEIVQSSSAASEESSAALEELYSQAQALREMVGKFKIKNQTKLETTS